MVSKHIRFTALKINSIDLLKNTVILVFHFLTFEIKKCLMLQDNLSVIIFKLDFLRKNQTLWYKNLMVLRGKMPVGEESDVLYLGDEK